MVILIILSTGCSSIQSGTDAENKLGISKHDWDNMIAEKKEYYRGQYNRYLAGLRENEVEGGDGVELVLLSGQVYFDHHHKDNFAFTKGFIKPGTCRKVMLTALNEERKKVALWVCLKKGKLMLDPSPVYQEYLYGSLQIAIEKWMDDGIKLCGISTQGAASIEDGCIWFRKTALKQEQVLKKFDHQIWSTKANVFKFSSGEDDHQNHTEHKEVKE